MRGKKENNFKLYFIQTVSSCEVCTHDGTHECIMAAVARVEVSVRFWELKKFSNTHRLRFDHPVQCSRLNRAHQCPSNNAYFFGTLAHVFFSPPTIGVGTRLELRNYRWLEGGKITMPIAY